MTASTVFWVWTWHIIAGAVGVLISVGAVYQWFEKKINSYKNLPSNRVTQIIDEAGNVLSMAEQVAYITFFNSLTDMGNLPRPAAKYSQGTKITLQSGEIYQVVLKGQFYEVQLIKRNGKKTYFRLYDKQQEAAQ